MIHRVLVRPVPVRRHEILSTYRCAGPYDASMSTETASSVRDRLRSALPVAMKARDRRTVAVVRATLAAIDNAESVELGEHRASALESSASGPGAAEVDRKHLTEADIVAIVRAEISERRRYVDGYVTAGRHERAAELRDEADTLAGFL